MSWAVARAGLARIFALVAFILLLVWVQKHCGDPHCGVGTSSERGTLFYWHPVLMVLAIVLLLSEGVLSYKSLPLKYATNRMGHFLVHLSAVVLAWIGFIIILKYHNDNNFDNFASVHSWMGMFTLVASTLHLLVGIWVFALKSPELDHDEELRRRVRFKGPHRFYGLSVYCLALATVCVGAMDKQSLITDPDSYATSKKMANVFALFVIFTGIVVCGHFAIPNRKRGGTNTFLDAEAS